MSGYTVRAQAATSGHWVWCWPSLSDRGVRRPSRKGKQGVSPGSDHLTVQLNGTAEVTRAVCFVFVFRNKSDSLPSHCFGCKVLTMFWYCWSPLTMVPIIGALPEPISSLLVLPSFWSVVLSPVLSPTLDGDFLECLTGGRGRLQRVFPKSHSEHSEFGP